MTAIETQGLTKRYGSGDDAVLAVDGLDLTVEEGEVFGFLGPNGAGKSTTIDMLLDYGRPTSGTATVLGLDAQDDSEQLRERIGVLPEGYGLYDRLTGRRHLEFAVEWQDADDDPDEILDRVGLDDDDAARPVGDYSKGMQQRLGLGMALVGQPDLLILDEPSSGLDPIGIREMRDIVRAEADRGATVFFSSHIMSEVEAVCDRVGILYEGELVAVDTIEGLREAAGAGSELRLRVDQQPRFDVAAMDGVQEVVADDGLLRVACEKPRAKGQVVARLENEGVTVLDVDAESVSLEDVFTAYTTGNGQIGSGDDEPADESRERAAPQEVVA
jgi:ABC-2 type transport system ATP-binding protein